MAYFLFIDESGHDRKASPYEVLAGVAIHDADLWELINKLHRAEIRNFGCRYSAGTRELKATHLLNTATFKHTALNSTISQADIAPLAKQLLDNGAEFSVQRLKALALAKLNYVRDVLEICTQYQCKIFASIVEADAHPTSGGGLRKDYAYMFERFFYFLEDARSPERGIIVFDELEKTKSHLLVNQTHHYFKETATGRHRSSLIVPEPFFVHSDLTTGIQIADIVAYCLSWAYRFSGLTKPARSELDEYVQQLKKLRHRCIRLRQGKEIEIWSVAHIRDLRTLQEIDTEDQ